MGKIVLGRDVNPYRLFDYTHYQERRESAFKQLSRKSCKVLVLSDIHIPFWDKRCVEKAINDNLDSDAVVINGDLFDLKALSPFLSTTGVQAVDEWRMVLGFMEKLIKTFAGRPIYLTLGNHEDRLRRRIAEQLSPQVIDLLNESQGRSWTDLGEILSKFLGMMGMSVGYYLRIGDAIILHSFNFSNVNMRSVEDAAKFVDNMEEIIDPWFVRSGGRTRCVVMGHTHRVGWTPRGNKLLIESGCLCRPLDYQMGPGSVKTGKYDRPWQGYVVLYQKNGVTDWNKTRPILLG